MNTIAVNGAGGKMGRLIMDVISEKEGAHLAQALEWDQHPLLGKDIHNGAVLSADLTEKAAVLIDFSQPAGTMKRLAECRASKTAMVIGTTGLSVEENAEVDAATTEIPIIYCSNTSLGVNLIFKVAAQIAQSLGEDFDIEIIEKHHRFKKDAPSGTALSIAESICEATGRTVEKDVVNGREGVDAQRKKGEIGMHAVRCGDIVGEHTTIFCSLGERIELTSKVHTRETFARGAVRAAEFLIGKAPGRYNMEDVLGL